MSACLSLCSGTLVCLAPGMILGWTVRPLGGIFRAAGGRIGLRRSATRAPFGRLYANGPGLSFRGRTRLVFRAGVGRQSAKLRGFGGRAPKASRRRQLLIVQVSLTQPNHQAAIPSPLQDHPAATLTGIDRLEQLIEA